jgi:5-methylcytosine-specific restriction protein A
MAWQSEPGRVNTPEWRALRRLYIRLFGNYCTRCGVDGRDVRLELDHVVPVAEGGMDDIDNVQLLCVVCHKPKTQAEAKRGRARSAARRRRVRVHPSDVLTTTPRKFAVSKRTSTPRGHSNA